MAVTPRDFDELWRKEATAAREQFVASWEHRVLENVEFNDRAGVLTVQVGASAVRKGALSDLEGRYPVDRSQRTLRVPAAVAYDLVRRWSANVVASSDEEQTYLRTAEQLVSGGLPWMAAYATARTIVQDEVPLAA